MNRRRLGWMLGITALFTCGFVVRPSEKVIESTLSQEDTTISKSFVMGKFLANTHERFSAVPPMMCNKPMYLQKAVIEAFQRMHRAALTAGIDLKIISGTRNFWEQKAIWERKWTANVGRFGTGAANAKHILLYSSMPGSSRHHWGTDIDINSLEPGYFKSGRGLSEINWLRKNAGAFGFCEVYTPRSTGRIRGYEPEAWHWSYMPLASQYLTYYSANIKSADFTGFYGSGLAAEIRIIEDYVKGIGCE